MLALKAGLRSQLCYTSHLTIVDKKHYSIRNTLRQLFLTCDNVYDNVYLKIT